MASTTSFVAQIMPDRLHLDGLGICVPQTHAMEINDPKIVALRQKVTAAQQEFDMAVTTRWEWPPD
jgi:hypothetical protein